MFPATSAPPAPILPAWPAWPGWGSPPSFDDGSPRKGVDSDGNRPPITTAIIMTATSTIWTSVVMPQTARASATVSAIPESDGRQDGDYRKPERVGQLSDLAEHLLIAAGAIGRS